MRGLVKGKRGEQCGEHVYDSGSWSGQLLPGAVLGACLYYRLKYMFVAPAVGIRPGSGAREMQSTDVRLSSTPNSGAGSVHP